MDRYEFDIKIQQIKKLMKKKDFATAVKIADAIEWRKVKENPLLIMAADVYEIAGKYDAARETLLLAYERTGLGRQLAYRLCRLSVKRGDFDEAQEFYEEFTQNSPRDAGKYILQYEMAKGRGESIDKQIGILETFIEEDMDDRWAYELAKLYHKAQLSDKCIELCDTIILWFADGKYVEKAMDLKQLYVPLSESQKLKFEAQTSKKNEAVVTEMPSKANDEDAAGSERKQSDTAEDTSESFGDIREETVEDGGILDKVHEVDIDVNSIHVKDFSENNKYDTMNIQRELAKSVSSMFDNTVEIFKPVTAKQDEDEQPVDDQITGQMNLEEVLAMFESGELSTREEKDESETAEDKKIDELEELAALISKEIESNIQEEIDEEIEEELFAEPEDLTEEEFEAKSEDVTEVELKAESEDATEVELEAESEDATEVELEAESEDAVSDSAEVKDNCENEEPSSHKETADKDSEEAESMVQEKKQEMSGPKQADIAKKELKNFIARFSGVQGLDKQILKVMQSILKTEKEPVKFIFVKGEVKSGKTTLAIDVIKLANKIMQRRDQKIGKFKGEGINDKSVDSLLKALDGSDILVEKVSDVKPEVFVEFMDKLREESKPRVVIFEDEKSLADSFISKLPQEYAEFANIIDIKVNKINDWAKVAADYAKKQGYIIDEMGTLALSAKIDQLRAITLVVHKNHIEQLIDGAIANSNKLTVGNLFAKFKNKTGDGYRVLTEKNFAD